MFAMFFCWVPYVFGLSADVARNSPADIRKVLQSYERKDIAREFLERSKDYQRWSIFLPLYIQICHEENIDEMLICINIKILLNNILIWNHDDTGGCKNRGSKVVVSGGDEERVMYSWWNQKIVKDSSSIVPSFQAPILPVKKTIFW